MICLCLDTQLKTEKKASFSQPPFGYTLVLPFPAPATCKRRGWEENRLPVMQAKLDLLQVGMLKEEAHQT